MSYYSLKNTANTLPMFKVEKYWWSSVSGRKKTLEDFWSCSFNFHMIRDTIHLNNITLHMVTQKLIEEFYFRAKKQLSNFQVTIGWWIIVSLIMAQILVCMFIIPYLYDREKGMKFKNYLSMISFNIWDKVLY